MPTPALCTVTYTLKIKFASGWEDVTPNLANVPTIRRGFAGPLARVAMQGTASFVLVNVSRDYSPALEAGMVPRLPVLFTMEYNGVSAVLFRGTLRDIRPTADICGVRKLVTFECVDDMSTLDRFKGEIELQINTHADTIIEAVVAAAYTPAATNYEAGVNAFPVAADRWSYAGITINSGRKGPTEMVTAAQKIEDATVSDWGHFFIAKDGTPTYYNRHHEILDATTALRLEAMHRLTYQKSEWNVINYVEVTCYPRTIGIVPEVLGRLSQTAAPSIAAGTTETYVLHFRDPVNQGIQLGGLDTIEPATTTDIICTNDPAGVGDDVTAAAIIVTLIRFGHRAELALENFSGDTVYVQKLQVRGLAVRSREPVSVIAQDATSIDDYDRHELPINAPLISSIAEAQALADHLVLYYRYPLDEVPSVTFSAHVNVTLMEAARDLELLERIWISEEQTGVEGYFHIYGINHRIRDNYNHEVTLSLLKAYDIGALSPFRLDISALNSGDVLIY